MLAKRIIPCLDVKNGRVVKGVNFLEPARCRRSGRAGAGLRSRRAPTSSSSWTSPPATSAATSSSTWCAGWPTACFIPFTVGGGIRTVDDMRGLLLAGADKVSINAGGEAARVESPRGPSVSAASASSWLSMASASATAGRCSSTAAGYRPGWRSSCGGAAYEELGVGRSC